jgi:CRISPR-associated protein Csm1
MRKIDKISLAGFLHDIRKFSSEKDNLLKDKLNLRNLLENSENNWVLISAEAVANGFEKENFDEYNNKKFDNSKYLQLKSVFSKNKKYKIDKLSPENIFSTTQNNDNKNLWDEFKNDLQKLEDKKAIDYLYKKYTSFISSSIEQNIPLYDHSKTTSIFATVIQKLVENGDESIINYYKNGEKEGVNKNNFLLIAGDFFGIQNFIFDKVKAKYASKMLRSKSAYVEILTRLSALYIVKKLGLNEFSIISSSAGKFEILAPNLESIKMELQKIKKELDEFFFERFFALTGIGVVEVECGIKDFIRDKEKIPYKNLRKKIADAIEIMKMEKFKNIDKFMFEYEKDINNSNICEFCEIRKAKKEKEFKICEVCEEYKKIGENLTKKEFLSFYIKNSFKECQIKFDNRGDYVFDISKNEKFRGYEKWEISSYVATKDVLNEKEKRLVKSDVILTFEELAKLSVIDGINENYKRERGVEAIGIFKGDVDFMGNFIQGLSEEAKKIDITSSFSKFNFFSRLINYFFSSYAPYLMRKKYNKIYTIFAGGDDIYIIGSWDEVLKFVKEIRNKFIQFCESQMKLSGGFVVVKSNKPINFISRIVENAEKEAKDYKKEQEYLKKEKNAFYSFNEVVSFDEYVKDDIDKFLEKYQKYLNTSFLYRILEFIEMSKNVYKNPLNSIWISKYEYVFRRNLEEVYKEIDFNELKNLLKVFIENSPSNLKIKLHEFIYKRRKNE